MAVARIGQELLGCLCTGFGWVVVLVVGGEGHEHHGAGCFFGPVQTVESDGCDGLPVDSGKDCAAQGSVGESFRVNNQAAGIEVLLAARLSAAGAVNVVVGGQAVCGHNIDFTVAEGCAGGGGFHLAEGDTFEQGLFTLPVLVGDDGEHLLGGIPVIDLVEAREVVIVDGIEQAASRPVMPARPETRKKDLRLRLIRTVMMPSLDKQNLMFATPFV